MERGSWDKLSSLGMGQFVWRYGVVCFGGVFFLANTPVRWLSIDPDLHSDPASIAALIVISFVYSISVGAAFGFSCWYVSGALSRLRSRLHPKSHDESVIVSSPLPAAKSHSAAANK